MIENIATWIVRIVAPLLGLGILFLTVPKLLCPPPPGLPEGQCLPGVSLESARNTEEVTNIIGKVPRPTDEVRKELRIDQYLSIPIYVLLFVALGVWLTSRNQPLAVVFGIAVIICIVLAAHFDYKENNRTFSVLSAFDTQSLNDSAVKQMQQASLLKWGLIAAALAIMSVPFFQSGRLIVVACIYALATISFAIGIMGYRPGLEWGFALMGLALLPTGEAIRFIP